VEATTLLGVFSFVATLKPARTMKRAGFFVLALGGWIGLATAQRADTLQLQTVSVQAPRPSYVTGYSDWKADTLLIRLMPSATVSDWLEQQGGLTLRTYGLGGLSTPAGRGSGSAQTAVLWDGFQLTSPMNGISDLALLPLFLLDDNRVQQGGSVANFGSGAIGGALHLSQSSPKKNQLRIFLEHGSFGQWGAGFRADKLLKSSAHSIRVFGRAAQHDFPYRNLARFGAPEEKLANAALTAFGAVLSSGFTVTKTDSLTLKLWYQRYSREIPPAMVQQRSVAIQGDEAVRLQWRWRHTGPIAAVEFRQLTSLESNRFVDSIANLNEDHRFFGLVTEAEWHGLTISSWAFSAVLHHSYYQAWSPAFDNSPVQNRFAGIGKVGYKGHRLSIQLAARQEWLNGRLVPFTPNLGLEWQLSRHWKLYGNAGRSFRLPTLNDLYWVPGGNPNLRPELGWQAEAGVQLELEKDVWFQRYRVGLYRQQLNDWIIWLPGPSGFWTPENLLEVRGRGIEANLHQRWVFGKSTIRFEADYAWVQSQHSRVAAGQENRLNKQLIYIPEHQLRARLWYERAQGYIGIIWNGTGLRYVQADHSEWLDAYAVSRVNAARRFSTRKIQGTVGVQLINLFDAEYQAIQWRPMPGRHYLLNFQFQLP